MALSPGETLGPYEILGKIGEGGMGEVYRGRDTRLSRDVAIKVSAERFNERFEREAKLVASLNHHNICSLFDVGPNFLVMELIEGPTLAERIADGPIPADEALHIAAQIADALQAAHDNGIVHRDLKPANIKIRPDGAVKVLDFGLAKIETAASSSPENSPTMSVAATHAGIILGTAAYMSPEQARGKPVDKRADIWAFGAVLYEMITGHPLFRGEDVSETLASVIMKEPDLKPIPPNLRRVLQRCLEKDPNKRLRDISGVGLLLERETTATASGGVKRPASSRLWPALAASMAILAAVLAAGWYRALPSEPELRPLIRLNVDLGSRVVFSSSALSGANVILSPDGQRLAYISQSRLHSLRLDQSEATELAGTEGAFGAFFSPDGKWLAFFSGGKLKKVAVDGGAVVTLCDTAGARGGTWTDDGNIIAPLSSTGHLSRIPEGGGAPTPITELAEGEGTHRWPQVVPGGKAVVFTANTGVTGFDTATIKIMSLIDGRTKTIQQGGTYGRVVKTPRGHAYLMYISRNALFAAPFDLDRLEVTGSPVPMLDGVGAASSGAVDLDISSEGALVFRSLAGGGLLTVQWMDAAGKLAPLIAKPGLYARPSLSPDGKRIAVEVTGSSGSDIFVYEPERDTMSRLTFGQTRQSAGPIWSRDGSYIAYQEAGGTAWSRSNGGGPHSLLLKSKNLQFPWSFGPDGKRLAYMEAGKNGYDLWTAPLEGDSVSGIRAGTPEPFSTLDPDERYPSFSPDGRWLAYSSNESGPFEVFVRAFPDNGSKWQVSSGGGAYPLWSRSGNVLFFETLEAQIMSASYSVKNDLFIPEKPRLWSPTPLVNLVNSVKNYDLAPDAKRIAALAPPPESGVAAGRQSHVTFLLNFFDELERRIPPNSRGYR